MSALLNGFGQSLVVLLTVGVTVHAAHRAAERGSGGPSSFVRGISSGLAIWCSGLVVLLAVGAAAWADRFSWALLPTLASGALIPLLAAYGYRSGGQQRELQETRRKAHQEQMSELCRQAFDAGPQDLIRVAQYAAPIAMVGADRETSFDAGVDRAMAGLLGACPEVELDSDMPSALRLVAGLDQHRYARVRHAMAHLGRTAGERFQAGCLFALGCLEAERAFTVARMQGPVPQYTSFQCVRMRDLLHRYLGSRGSALICPDDNPYRLTTVRPGHATA